MFLVFQIIAFELVVVNSPYNDENTRHPSAVNVLMCMSIVTFPVVFQPIASCECLHNYCVCVKRKTLWIACVLLLLLVTLPPLSGISGNLEQKIILQTIEQLIHYTVLEIQSRSLKYTVVIKIRKQKFEQLSIPIHTIQGNYSVLI